MDDPWLVPPDHRPTCPLNGRPCTSWTCLVDVCVDPTREAIEAQVEKDLVRELLEAMCRRNGVSLDSDLEPGKPARNYQLAIRLGIGEVFGV